MYLVFDLAVAADLHELLIAYLADAGFDSFEEGDDHLQAYATVAERDKWVDAVEELRQRYRFTYTVTELPEQNWNAIWERGFSPIRVGDRLLIRASFHPADAVVDHDLVIDPRMAFGTGHHATTYMMCELLLEHEVAGAAVLDYGCGTGVLAILARRLGAATVDAVDIEEAAAENTADNAAANGVELDEIVHGRLDDVPDARPYDLVLANINRNVLLDTGEALRKRLRSGGTAFLSGILAQDEARIVEHFRALGFTLVRSRAREDWRAFEFTRA